MTTENATSKDEQIKAIAKCAKELAAVQDKIEYLREVQSAIQVKYAVGISVREGCVLLTADEQRRVLARGIDAELVDLAEARDALIRKLYIGCKTLLGSNEAETQNPTVHDWMT